MCTQLGAKLQNTGLEVLIRRIVETLPCSSGRAESHLAGGTADTGTAKKTGQTPKNQAVHLVYGSGLTTQPTCIQR